MFWNVYIDVLKTIGLALWHGVRFWCIVVFTYIR